VVAPHEIARAETALRAAGFTAGAGRDEPYKRDWNPPDDDGRIRSFELWHARSKWKLELHDGLHFDYLIEQGVHLDRHAPVSGRLDALGVPLRVPDQPLLTAMLATHLSGEPYQMRLLRLVELVLVVRQDTAAGTLDWSAVEALLDRAGALRFAWPAFALVEQLAPGTIDGRVLARSRDASTALARDVMRGYTPTAPILRRTVSLAERLMWTHGRRERARLLLRMLLPPRGTTLAGAVRVYHARIRRFASGGVSWRGTAGSVPRGDAR
jgi:hypothetical protein